MKTCDAWKIALSIEKNAHLYLLALECLKTHKRRPDKAATRFLAWGPQRTPDGTMHKRRCVTEALAYLKKATGETKC